MNTDYLIMNYQDINEYIDFLRLVEDVFYLPVPRRIVRDSSNPLEMFNDVELRQCFKFSGNTIRDVLLPMVFPTQEQANSRGLPIPPIIKLCTVLCYYASGSYQEHKTRVEQACRTAEDFVKHYYEGLDRRRNVLSRLYLDAATLIWNGNGVAGKEFIQKFFEGLPTTDHVVSSIDSQPLIGGPGCHFPVTLVICVSGFVAFSEDQPAAFQQQLLIMAEGDKWKIVSDCFRFQDP